MNGLGQGTRITFDEYQVLAERSEKRLQYADRINHAMLGLASEVGELAGTVKKWHAYNQELDVRNIQEELGDILWYMALLCNIKGLSFGEIAQDNLAKLAKRYPERYTDALALARLDKPAGE